MNKLAKLQVTTRPLACLSSPESALQALHARQIALLSQWRRERPASEPWRQLLFRLLETVNAIAAGLGTTG